jgi:hypothetical protein
MSTHDCESARQQLKSFAVWRQRFSGGAIGASLETCAGPRRTFWEPVGGLLMLMPNGLKDQREPAVAISDSALVPFRMFELIADLARDGERGHGHKPSSDAAGGTAAEDTETATPAAVGTGPASADAMASQPGGDPVNLADESSQQNSDEKERGQRSPPFEPPGSPSSEPPDRPKEEPRWLRSNLPMRSAG